ncbi:MAG TPA: glycosyltransferase [Hymenobacter sp.]|nr:glycosyltransferase [Hymenobacter sp.]
MASVIIPAKNEAKRLVKSLQALASQADFTGRPWDARRFEVLVLATNYNDQTAALARRFAQSR